MSGTHAAAGSAEFTEVWRNVSTLCHNKPGQPMPETATSSVCNDLQSPKRRSCSRYFGLNNGDSPGDGEASQDIFWDSTSPPQPNTGLGVRTNRVVEISDIVKRIAPKDVKGKGTDSPLLQWIGDSAVPCTPEIPKPRLRKKSSRQSSVEDLMKLARQFDANMQQDQEISEKPNTLNNNLSKCVNTSQTKLTETTFHSNTKDLKCPSSSDQAEAELHALFDCSTQKVSGQLSQGSSASARSQEIKDLPGILKLAEPRQSKFKPTDKSNLAALPAEQKGSRGFHANNCDNFDDDWENDDLLNDSFVLAMTQNPDQQIDINPKTTFQTNAKTNTPQFSSVCKSTANTNAAPQSPNSVSKPSCSSLQELCPTPKTTNRSTFKLQPNPYFQSKSAAKEFSKSSFTGIQPKSQMSDKTFATTNTPSTPPPDNADDHSGARVAAKDISDRLWDDGEDDALLYQVCDSVERISNSQPQQVSSSDCQQKQDITVDRERKTTEPLPIDATRAVKDGAGASRQAPCGFVRSNSLPSTSYENVNCQGWNFPVRGANNKTWMSQSLPGSHVSLGTSGQCKEPSETFQDSTASLDTQPRTVAARLAQISKYHHTAFKRNVSDSTAISSKVFVTNQMTGKCSAAEIERKKQEALARRRLRMQNAPKP